MVLHHLKALTIGDREDQLKDFYGFLMGRIEETEAYGKPTHVYRDGERIRVNCGGFKETFDIQRSGEGALLTPCDEDTDYAEGHYCHPILTHRQVLTSEQCAKLMEKLKIKNA